MGELATARNLGVVSEQRLNAVGVHRYADLERLGSVEVYRRLRVAFPGISRNFLYALEGALLDERFDRLPCEILDRLRAAATDVEATEA